MTSSILSRSIDFAWKTKLLEETVGGIPFRFHALKSLDETIDDLFLLLEKTGNPNLLEDLCPYFGHLWPSARGLCEHLATYPIEAEGAQRVVEVGCGLAIPSFFLARTVKLSKITATDFHPEVGGFFDANFEENRLSKDRLEYRELNWRAPDLDLGKFSVVIGSDILYEKNHPSEVADALEKISKHDSRILIADPARPYLQVFVDEMKSRGFYSDSKVYRVPDGATPKDVFVFEFRKRPFPLRAAR